MLKLLVKLGEMKKKSAIVSAFMVALIKVAGSSLTIEMPKGNFCELDDIAACKFANGDCVRYDPGIAAQAPSIVTYLTDGKTSNAIQAYITLLWVKWEHGVQVFMEEYAKKFLSTIFTGLDKIPSLEKGLCDPREYQFQRVPYKGSDLTEDQLTGKALALHPPRGADGQPVPTTDPVYLQSGRFRTNWARTVEALRFLPELRTHARKTLKGAAKKVC